MAESFYKLSIITENNQKHNERCLLLNYSWMHHAENALGMVQFTKGLTEIVMINREQ